jgi:hypothetical protein
MLPGARTTDIHTSNLLLLAPWNSHKVLMNHESPGGLGYFSLCMARRRFDLALLS